MRGWTLIAIALAAAVAAPAYADDVVTIDGFVSSGSNMGLISDGSREYAYGGTTRNLAALAKACPVRMGELVPCRVTLKAAGGSATEIVSASASPFGGIAINKPGEVSDASVCDHPSAVDYSIRPGCKHFDSLMVQVLSMKNEIAKLSSNGQVKYALSQRVLINCHGTAISLASYVGKNFPPGLKEC
jgi:hypothetical protein